MILYTIEIVRDAERDKPRYIVRVPDLEVGIGASSPTLALAGCLAMHLGFERWAVEEKIAAKERYL